jgi:hypothetical protein
MTIKRVFIVLFAVCLTLASASSLHADPVPSIPTPEALKPKTPFFKVTLDPLALTHAVYGNFVCTGANASACRTRIVEKWNALVGQSSIPDWDSTPLQINKLLQFIRETDDQTAGYLDQARTKNIQCRQSLQAVLSSSAPAFIGLVNDFANCVNGLSPFLMMMGSRIDHIADIYHWHEGYNFIEVDPIELDAAEADPSVINRATLTERFGKEVIDKLSSHYPLTAAQSGSLDTAFTQLFLADIMAYETPTGGTAYVSFMNFIDDASNPYFVHPLNPGAYGAILSVFVRYVDE